MFKEADVIFSKIANSESVKILAQNFYRLRKALIGPEKVKETDESNLSILVRIIATEIGESKTIEAIAENIFLGKVKWTAKEIGMSGWDVQITSKHPDHKDKVKYISFKSNGGYYLWLQIQQGQKIIFCKRSSPNY